MADPRSPTTPDPRSPTTPPIGKGRKLVREDGRVGWYAARKFRGEPVIAHHTTGLLVRPDWWSSDWGGAWGAAELTRCGRLFDGGRTARGEARTGREVVVCPTCAERAAAAGYAPPDLSGLPAAAAREGR